MSTGDWEAFRIDKLLEKKANMTFPYLEFVRAPSLSCGIYTLAAGAKDLQGPHDEDEVYFVIDGTATIRVGSEEQEVGPGSIIYVAATAEHRFVEITSDITLLVFFGSPGASA
jgi:mannose-6-phosphate isomerase-like protein (cupin superfamily)